MPPPERRPRTLILACGALVRELRAVLSELTDQVGSPITTEYLPAPLHNRPERIVPAVAERLDRLEPDFGRVLLGYGDCGTGGALDRYLDQWRADPDRSDVTITRLAGDHCYAFLTGTATFARLHGDELGTFFLTDFIVRHFDTLIWSGLGLDRHPELRDLYFGHYTRALWLSQGASGATGDPAGRGLAERARAAAERLGLDFEHHHTGLDPFRTQLVTLAGAA